MPELPWVISVDDHVVEPPHLWKRWLPDRFRDRGPRIERDACETLPTTDGSPFVKGGDGPVVDWWVYEDLVRPMPLVMACAGIPKEQYTMAPISFSEMRPGCYDPAARLADMDINHVERSLCFPELPAFRRPDVQRG